MPYKFTVKYRTKTHTKTRKWQKYTVFAKHEIGRRNICKRLKAR